MSDIDDDMFGFDSRQMQEAQELFEQEVAQVDLILLKAFTTPNGKKALEYMSRVASQVGADPRLGFDKGAPMGFFREGQAQLVFDIKERMKRGEQYIKQGSRG